MKLDFSKIKKSYGINLKSEVEGMWFPLALIDGVDVKVARAGNPAYKKALKRLYKPYTQKLRRGQDISQSIEDRIQIDLLVQTLLKNWKGMPGEKGSEVKYSEEIARELLSDPELKELRDEIISFSEEFEKFQEEVDKETEKN